MRFPFPHTQLHCHPFGMLVIIHRRQIALGSGIFSMKKFSGHVSYFLPPCLAKCHLDGCFAFLVLIKRLVDMISSPKGKWVFDLALNFPFWLILSRCHFHELHSRRIIVAPGSWYSRRKPDSPWVIHFLFTLATIVILRIHRFLVRSYGDLTCLLWERLWSLSFWQKDRAIANSFFSLVFQSFEWMEGFWSFLAAIVRIIHRSLFLALFFDTARLKISVKRGHRRKQFFLEIRLSFKIFFGSDVKPTQSLILRSGGGRIEVNHMTVWWKIQKRLFFSWNSPNSQSTGFPSWRSILRFSIGK